MKKIPRARRNLSLSGFYPFENSINKCSGVPSIGLRKELLKQTSNLFLLPSSELLPALLFVSKKQLLDPSKTKEKPHKEKKEKKKAWVDLHLPLTISLSSLLSFCVATVAGFSPVTPMASSVTTAVKPVSFPLIVPFLLPVSS